RGSGSDMPLRASHRPKVRKYLLALGDMHQLLQATGFGLQDSQAEAAQAIVAPALFAVDSIDAFLCLDDQAVLEHALDRSVKRSRSHSHRATCTRPDFLHHGIAVL